MGRRKEKKEPKKKSKIKRRIRKLNLNSIHAKITTMSVAGIVLAASVIFFVLVGYMKELVIDSAYGKMLNTISSYGKLIDVEEEKLQGKNPLSSKAVLLSAEQYGEILKDFSVDGVDNFYYFIIDSSGIIRYHTDSSRIGKPNTNSVITRLMGDIAKGVVPDNLCAEFEEDGDIYYASYYVTGIKSAVVVCANGDELMNPIRKMVIISVITVLALLAGAVVLSRFITGRITNPLWKLNGIINDISDLKLSLENMEKLCSRKDETGMMSRAVQKMNESLYDIIHKLEEASISIRSNMDKLEASGSNIHELCTENSATTQQLVSSTQKVSETTTLMNEHVSRMTEKSELIEEEVGKSSQVSREIAEKTTELQEVTLRAISETKRMYEEIKKDTQLALEKLKAVKKINELTDAIVEISDQTNLLSLNASIEAARAGEAGRGFAVVAKEISTLAKRSLDTVEDINRIITETNSAVENITSCMSGTTDFLEKTVLSDYDTFRSLSERYMTDADTFREGMEAISVSVTELNSFIGEVSASVEVIHDVIEETLVGVDDIAKKTVNVVAETKNNHALAEDTNESVKTLEEIIGRFEYD